MSNIFDINTLLQENTLAGELLAKTFPKETYMYSAINSLKEFNESVLGFNKDLYKSLNEANSKSEENAVFGDFYNKYGYVLNKYINEINSMVGRFSITLDNLVDANAALLKDQNILSSTAEFTVPAKKYKNLTGGKYPKFNPLELYQKEFDYIGQMMQDLGPVATDIAKMEVLATVSNSFCNKMKNKWLEKCVEMITGEEDCENLTCYAKILQDIFIEEDTADITINRGTIYAMKSEIDGYEKYKDSILGIANKLISDFSYMSKNIGSMFYRNKDNVLAIRSDSNDVESRDYKLNTYGMNQLDIFMKSKVNQVSQLCSLYVIALSVMMDSIIGYVTQCKEILEKVQEEVNKPEVEEEPQECESMEADSDIEDNDDTEEEPEEPDEDGEFEGSISDDSDEPAFEGEEIPEEPELEGDEPEVPDDTQTEEPEEEPVELEMDEDSADFENESYLFEYMDYAVQNMLEQNYLIEYVHKEILKEADLPNGPGLSKDNSFIENILIAFTNIVSKFQQLFQKKRSAQAEFIKNSQNNIKECTNFGGSKCTRYNQIQKLYGIKLYQFNYEQFKDCLNSQEDFLAKKFTPISDAMKAAGENKISIKEAVMKMIGDDGSENPPAVDAGSLSDMVTYCVEYGNRIKDVMEDNKAINNSKNTTKTIIKQVQQQQTTQQNQNNTPQIQTQQQTSNSNSTPQNASAYMTADDYLNEAIVKPDASQAPKQTGSTNGDITKQVQLFFSVSTKVSSARMTAYNKVFTEYFTIINDVLKLNGKPAYSGKKDNADQNNNQQTAQTTNSTK